jgi:protoporphyrinogen oxidase
MQSVEYLVVGAGVSGLSFANAIRQEASDAGTPAPEMLIVEADSEPGGYCKTIVQDGFTWDYSGHFFHFRKPEIEAWLRARMPGQDIRTVTKKTSIRYQGLDIDFPFQKNIHQLAQPDFIDCLVSLYFRDEGAAAGETPSSFKDMLMRRFGRGIAERFLIPYNEKLYACDLDRLDVEAMGRFFPHADIADIIRNMQQADNSSYNASFSYPLGGAIQFIHALLQDLPPDLVGYSERLVSIDLHARIATTSSRQIKFDKLISSAPFDKLCQISALQPSEGVFSSNKVLVFNLGFDKKGAEGVHWVYFPDKSLPFYRIGFYDNIMDTERMSLYVELGAASGRSFDIDEERQRVLEGLQREGYVGDHKLVSWHSVTLDPAYVHITRQSMAEHQRLSLELQASGVYAVGRYGGWTYCSIEDNIIETRALAKSFRASP